jgi:hypothetical protein
MQRSSLSRVAQDKTACIWSVVKVLLNNLTGFNCLQDFLDANSAEWLFVHLFSSMVGESAIGCASPNLGVFH